MSAGRHLPALQLCHLVLLKDSEDVPVSEVAVDACLEAVDVDGGREKEYGEVGGALTDHGQASQLQEEFHLIPLPGRSNIGIVFGLFSGESAGSYIFHQL